MATSELEGMAQAELEERLTETRRELFNLRFQKATGQLDNTARLGQARREIARVLTILRQRELGIDEATLLGERDAALAPLPERPARTRRGRIRRAAAETEDTEEEA